VAQHGVARELVVCVGQEHHTAKVVHALEGVDHELDVLDGSAEALDPALKLVERGPPVRLGVNRCERFAPIT
jgi:hypothetical protein